MPELRTRRDPPPFRRAEVARVVDVTPHLRRITLTGPELEGLPDRGPASSLRLLVPVAEGLVVPTWNGNVWLFEDGSRAPIRTLTPRRVSADPGSGRAPELDVDVVLHGAGPISRWAASAAPGTLAAVSGTGRGIDVGDDGAPWVLLGDESALPAIATLLEALPPSVTVEVLAEVAHPDARHDLPAHPGATVAWCDLPLGDPHGSALVAAAIEGPLAPGRLAADARVFAAGEAASIQRIRRHVVDELGHPRPRTVIRGYWKHGRAATDDED
jgi:NADPH-dependent ferric siderophore reductase